MKTQLRHSKGSTFQSCRMKYLLLYILGLQQTAPALSTGSVWHDMLESYWQPVGVGSPAHEAVVALDTWRTSIEEMSWYDRPEWCTERWIDNTCAILESMLITYDKGPIERPWTLIDKEQELSVPAVCPSGKRSSVIEVGGRLDGRAFDDSRNVWVLEHKTSSTDLSKWRDKYGMSRQAVWYCWLSWQTTGVVPAGVIFDLSLKTLAPTAPDWQVLKNGKGLMKKPPANATAELMDKALAFNMFQLDDIEWYRPMRDELAQRDYPFHRVEVVRVTPEQMLRAQAEMYTIGKEMREKESIIRQLGYHLDAEGQAVMPPREIGPRLDIITKAGHEFYRNTSQCHTYNRQCPVADVCMTPCADTLAEAIGGVRA